MDNTAYQPEKNKHHATPTLSDPEDSRAEQTPLQQIIRDAMQWNSDNHQRRKRLGLE